MEFLYISQVLLLNFPIIVFASVIINDDIWFKAKRFLVGALKVQSIFNAPFEQLYAMFVELNVSGEILATKNFMWR